jgi:hypothetical protein
MHLRPYVDDRGADESIREGEPAYTGNKSEDGGDQAGTKGIDDEAVQNGGHTVEQVQMMLKQCLELYLRGSTCAARIEEVTEHQSDGQIIDECQSARDP